MDALTALLAAVHDAYLQQREAGTARRLRACRTRLPDQPRPRQARRAPIEAPQAEPAAVSSAPTFAKARKAAKPRTPRRSAADFAMTLPTAADILAWCKQLADEGHPVCRNDDGQVSSPELTARYVAQVLRLNHYK